MHKSLLLLVVIATFVGACSGGEDARGRNKVGKLTNIEYDRLNDLNDLQQDNIDARENLYGFTTFAISEKSKAMSEKLAAGCVRTGNVPDNDMNGGIHEETINGGNCPIYWFRRRHYNVADKIMNFADNLVIENDQYRKDFSPFYTRSFSGTYKVTPEGAGFRVFGVIKFTEFSTVNYGRLQGAITVDHKNIANEGSGHVTLVLNSSRGWNHNASIIWSLRRGAVTNIIYRVDGNKVEREDFFDLFSAYEMDKFMDNALRMK